MCDEGRLWYKELQKESRILRPLARGEQDLTAVSWDDALTRLAQTLTRVKEEHGANAVAGIIGAKATNEEVYLFSHLLTERVGTELVAGLSWSPADASHDNFLVKADKNPNTRGLQAMGFLDGGASAADVLAAAEQGTVKVLLVFAVDLVPAFGPEKLDAALGNVEVVVFDTDYSGTTEYADVLLPIGTAPETDGTVTNYAGRVQRLRQAFPPPGEARPGWEVLSQLGVKFGGTDYLSSAEVFAELADKSPASAGLTHTKLGSHGVQLPGEGSPTEPPAQT
ncbi:MAG TPA: molybdopterin-dependent oxidoreductase, partial [Candidatus Binatia bacterium]|nr:molybdopterin-dependent oxidoreductase [Candidatus Binatia bacterium]